MEGLAMQAEQLTQAGSTEIYQAPTLIELGDLVPLTTGSLEDDTADRAGYYY